MTGAHHFPHPEIRMQMLEQLVANATVDTTQSGWRTKIPKPAQLAFTPGQTWRNGPGRAGSRSSSRVICTTSSRWRARPSQKRRRE